MPVVVEADADDAAAAVDGGGGVAAAAGVGGEVVNLGAARVKGESKEEKKARKEAVKEQVGLLLLQCCNAHPLPLLPPFNSELPTEPPRKNSKKRTQQPPPTPLPLLSPPWSNHPPPPPLTSPSVTLGRASVGRLLGQSRAFCLCRRTAGVHAAVVALGVFVLQ